MRFAQELLYYKVLIPVASKVMGFLYILQNRHSALNPNKTYVFIFLGEFGYELLDWQGKIRYLKNSNPTNRLAFVSRNSCEFLYKDMGTFIAIENSNFYINSKADSYFARPPQQKSSRINEMLFSIRLHRSIRKLMRSEFPGLKLQLVFSDRVTFLDHIQFGANIVLHGHNIETACYQTGIYETVTLNGNDFRIPTFQSHLTKKNSDSYVLFMKAERGSHNKDFQKIDVEDYLQAIDPSALKKILMEFRSTRVLDSHGSIDIDRLPSSITHVLVETLEQQLELIGNAAFCIFFSQGDLRSHVYLPPLIGKDVYVICSNVIADFPYIDHWNTNVFKFGGKIRIVGSKKEDFLSLLKTLEG